MIVVNLFRHRDDQVVKLMALTSFLSASTSSACSSLCASLQISDGVTAFASVSFSSWI